MTLIQLNRATRADAPELIAANRANQEYHLPWVTSFIGYYGMSNFSRKGLMTEALRAAVDHAFDDLGLHRLEANIQPENQASIALVRRLGFQKEGHSPRYLRINGEWRDHERWALLADMAEWRRTKPIMGNT
ncbi:MAG: GNAT family N-acetyltransferase [Alcaligenes sp.]